MIELNVVELVLEGTHDVAVSLHLLVVATRVLHDLVDYELRVSRNVEVLDAGLDGDLEAAEEGLILRHVVRGGEVQTHGIPNVFPEGRDEEQTHARPDFHHRPIEVKGPTLVLDLQRG
jgi:hypothetical protein